MVDFHGIRTSKEDLTMNWILTPDKFLNDEEVQKLRKVCIDKSDLGRSKKQFKPIRACMIINQVWRK